MFVKSDLVKRALEEVAYKNQTNRDTLISFWAGIPKPTRQEIIGAGNSYISTDAQPSKVRDALISLGATELHRSFIRGNENSVSGTSIEYKFPLSIVEDINLVEGVPVFAVISECPKDSEDWYIYHSYSSFILIATVGEIGSGSDIEFKNNYLDSDSRVRLGSFTLTIE